MIVHIVPTVPPDINGVADYCYKLWQHWPEPRPDWKCVTAHIPPEATSAWPEAKIIPFELSRSGLLAALEKAGGRTVVLHYVGYAYHRKGIPWWLPSALHSWKTRSSGRLCVMFHEVYATGSPRQSAFWLVPISRNIVVQLLRCADLWVTSCEAAASKLMIETNAQAKCGRVVPVGTGIEPEQKVDFERPWPLEPGAHLPKTKLRIAVFGLASSRIAALRSHQNWLKLLCQKNEIECISLIGKSGNKRDAESLAELQNIIAPPALWRAHHDLPPNQISDLLMNHDMALSLYPPSLLTKSSVYAAFCAHGLLTLCRPETLHQKESFQSKEMSLALPYLQNDDSRPEISLGKLHDETTIRDLKAQVREADQGFLSWRSITQVWAELTRSETVQAAAKDTEGGRVA